MDRDDRLRADRADHVRDLPLRHVPARVVLKPAELEEPDPVRDGLLDLIVLLDRLALRVDEGASGHRADVDQLRHRREIQLDDELVLVVADVIGRHDSISELAKRFFSQVSWRSNRRSYTSRSWSRRTSGTWIRASWDRETRRWAARACTTNFRPTAFATSTKVRMRSTSRG